MKVLRTKDLCKVLNVSEATVYRLINSNELPPRVRCGRSAKGWLESDIEKWIEERKER